MKQTAVDFLVKEFSDIIGKINLGPISDLLLVDAIKKAKEMEKKQIINAVHDSMGINFEFDYRKAEQYYNQTYGK